MSVSSEVARLTNAKSDIAAAITEKGVEVPSDIKLDGMAELIRSIASDNWIGDGNTHIWIHLEDGRLSPMLGCCPNGTVTVDWGDGTAPNTLTGTNIATVQWTPNHNYAEPGDYIITLSVNGSLGFAGESSSNTGPCILRHSNATGGDGRNQVYRNSVRKVEMGNGVTYVGQYAFAYCYSLESVIISNSVTAIEQYAFQSCYSLTGVNISNSVTKIGKSVFNSCYSLTSVTIPNSVTSFAGNVFYNCYSLSNIILSNKIHTITTNAFGYCYSLASVIIPNSVTTIESSAFNSCKGMKYYDFTTHYGVPILSSTNAFTGIPADCEIRVPKALYGSWKAATNWSTYSSKIVAV